LKKKTGKLAVVVHVVQTTQNFSFHVVVVLQRTAKKCTKNYNARAKPLFCSLNVLFNLGQTRRCLCRRGFLNLSYLLNKKIQDLLSLVEKAPGKDIFFPVKCCIGSSA